MRLWRSVLVPAIALATVLGAAAWLSSLVNRLLPEPDGLYEDEEIRARVGYDIDQASRAADQLMDVPSLDGVLFGEQSITTTAVFERLGLRRDRVREFRTFGAMRTLTLLWQVSPSYDLVCVTDYGDWEEKREPDDPTWRVCEIRFILRGAFPGW